MKNSQEILSTIMYYINKSGKTSKECLIACDINTSFLTDWKNGKIKMPSYDKIVKLAEFLDIDISYLFTGKEASSRSHSLTQDKIRLIEMYDMLTDIEKGEILGELKYMVKEKQLQHPEIRTVQIAARSTNKTPPRIETGDFSDILNAPDSTDDYK